jgi:hypothetical protein
MTPDEKQDKRNSMTWYQIMDEVRPLGRSGMNEADHYNLEFEVKGLYTWSTKEIRNRLNWLRSRKYKGLKDSRGNRITDEKIAKYAKALFERESIDGQEKTRKMVNYKKRHKRAVAKKKRLLVLAKAAQTRQRAQRAALKLL